MQQGETYNKTNLLKYSVAEAITWLNTEYYRFSGQDLTSKIVTNPAGLRQASSQLDHTNLQDQNGVKVSELSYPYVLYTIGDISLNQEKSGMNKRSYRRVYTSKDIDAGEATYMDLRPVKVAIGLTFNTDDFNMVLDFAYALLYNAPTVGLYLQTDTGFTVNNTLHIDPAVTAPPVNSDTPGDAYQFSTLLTVDTYIGIIDTTRLIRNISFGVFNQDQTKADFYNGEAAPLVKNTFNFKDYYERNSRIYGDGNVNR